MSGGRNIAFLLTPPQPAAIAVVRLVGPGVDAFLGQHFEKPLPLGRCVHGRLYDDGREVIDDPLIVRTEDYADVNLHGGPWIVRSMLDLAEQHGFEVCDQLPIPLPHHAVEGRDAIEKAVLAAIPLAGSELGLRRLLEQTHLWRSLPDSPADLHAMSEDWELWWLLHPPTVAIAGIANAGKSTLANQLFAQQRSITADIPGTTRDWVGDMADINGLPVHLIDTPGIRTTDDPIESEAITRAAEQLENADLILVMLDATAPIAQQEHVVREYPRAILVVNKFDRGEIDVEGFRTVATTGLGVGALRDAICEHFHIGGRPGKAKWWTKEQREELRLHASR